MTIDRRDFLVTGSAAAVGAMLPGTAVAQTQDDVAAFEAEFEKVNTALRETFSDWGFRELTPHPIVSGDFTFNGGLRHDADAMMIMPGAFVIQPSARMSDIEERARPDLLPLFNVFLAMLPQGASDDEQVALAHALLTETFGLDPSRIAFASVPEAEKMHRPLANVGWDLDHKVLIRDPDEARRSRDSSGYFYPHPDEPFFVTSMGIYFRLSDEGETNFTTYPPPTEWTEIGELVIGQVPSPAIVLGVERVTLAASSRYPQWRHRLEQLQNAVEAAGIDTLPALDAFAN